MLAALERVGFDPEETEKSRHGRADPVGQELRVVAHAGGGHGQRAQNREWPPGGAPRRVDRELGGLAEAPDPVAVLPPRRQALAPRFRLAGGERIGIESRAAGFQLLDPGPEVLGPQLRECEQEVPEIALGVDRDRGDAVEGGLFDQVDAEPRLSAAGHPHAERMGREVAGIVEERGSLFSRRPHAPQIEHAKLLELPRIHAAILRAAGLVSDPPLAPP